MRWGLVAATIIAVDVLAFVACDEKEGDDAPRFLLPVPPDAADDARPDTAIVPPKPQDASPDVDASDASDADAGYDPAVLSLTGWWRAPYVLATWAGSASAGMSAGRPLVEGATPPEAGTAVNGRVPAAFDGLNDKLANPTPISMLLSAAAWSAVVLVYADAVTTTADAGSLEIMSDTLGYWSIGTGNTPGPKALIGQFDGTQRSVETPMNVAAWNLIQTKFDGTNLRIRVNSGIWVTALSNNIQVTTGTLNVGRDFTGTLFYKGKMLEAMTAATALPDATFNDIKGYMNLRYGLTL